MSNKPNLILVIPFMSSFIESDLSILRDDYNVRVNLYKWSNKSLAPFYLLAQFFYFFRYILSSKKIVIQFGGYWSLVPAIFGRVFGKPVFIILHGTDCASIPDLNYGSLRIPLLKSFTWLSYKLATKLLPVSESLVEIKNDYVSDSEYKNQGYKYFFPDVITKYEVVHNGLDSGFWFPQIDVKRDDNSFLAVFSKTQFLLKGGDLILQLANHFNNYKFYIAGVSPLEYEGNVPRNIVFLGKLSKEELRNYYSSVKYYFQLSVFEGFGLSLAEAMLCECIPIGSSVNIIPEIIGNTGFVLSEKNIEKLIELINQVTSNEKTSEYGVEARKRIIKEFNLLDRKNKLLSILKG